MQNLLLKITTGLVMFLAAVSLACSMSPRSASAPIFLAPGGEDFPTETPAAPAPIGGGLAPTPETEILLPEINLSEDAESTENPGIAPPPTATPTQPIVNTTPILYYTQAGDTLPVVAVRFGVQPEEISSPEDIPEQALFNPGQLLIIPNRLANTTSSQHFMPDSEIVYSPSALDFDVQSFVDQSGGYLAEYSQYLATTGITTGAEVIERVAIENSINPRLLLALLEFQSNWVNDPEPTGSVDYPLGRVLQRDQGLYKQLAWAVNQLSIGYYGWREGRLTEIQLKDGISTRLAPDLNAGTAALQYYFAQLFGSGEWVAALDLDEGFPALYERMFGSPWVRALSVEPLYPPDLNQPPLILPFMIDQIWSYSGGPHGAWERDGAWAAVDFAPGSTEHGCFDTDVYTVAAAPGLVVRSENGVIAVDLDGDGREQTGWVLMYLHVADRGRVTSGTWVEKGDLLGHPSCEGGFSTGTHLHLARKYNGEWIMADGPLPFVMSGWTVNAGEKAYEGTLIRGERVIPANPLSPFESRIIRRSTDP
ncbi:MAG: M23 family metallopeptidase [Chloroflexota bacterium]|nr:MAG: M23 family metallopeptidase [Chloroflexota bacterium]